MYALIIRYLCLFFQRILDYFKTFISMADISIHSRYDRQHTQFTTYINISTNGQLQSLLKHSRPISLTQPDIVTLALNFTNRTNFEVIDTVGSDHVPIKVTSHRNSAPQPTTFPKEHIPTMTLLIAITTEVTSQSSTERY